MEEVSTIVKTLRIGAHLTQKEFADVCGVTASAVSGWETGRVKNLTPEVVGRLSHAFHISPAYLYRITNDKENPDIQHYAITQEDYELLQAFHSMSKKNQQLIEAMLQALTSHEHNSSPLAAFTDQNEEHVKDGDVE